MNAENQYQQPAPAYPPAAAPGNGSSAQQQTARQTTGIVLLACGLLFVIALFTKGWGTASEGRDHVNAGLFGLDACGRGQCISAEWDWAQERLDIPSDVNVFRILGLLAGFLALGGIIGSGVMVLTRNAEKIPARALEISLGIAAFTLTSFAFRLAMADKDVNFGPSYSALLGIGALIGTSVVVRRMLIPMQKDLASAAPPSMHQPPGAMSQPRA